MGPKAVWPSSENCRPNWVQSKCLVKPAWLLSYFSCFFCLLLLLLLLLLVLVLVVGGGGWWVGVGVVLVILYVCVVGFPLYVSYIPYPLRYVFF